MKKLELYIVEGLWGADIVPSVWVVRSSGPAAATARVRPEAVGATLRAYRLQDDGAEGVLVRQGGSDPEPEAVA